MNDLLVMKHLLKFLQDLRFLYNTLTNPGNDLIDFGHEVLIIFKVVVLALFSQTSTFDMVIPGGWCDQFGSDKLGFLSELGKNMDFGISLLTHVGKGYLPIERPVTVVVHHGSGYLSCKLSGIHFGVSTAQNCSLRCCERPCY